MRQRHHRNQEALGAFAPAQAPAGRHERPAGDHAMQMDVMLQRLAPGMQHGRHADCAAEVLLGKGLERLIGGGEQQVIDGFRVDLGQRIDPVIEREDHVKVRHGQQPGALLRQPLRPLEGAAFGAVPIAAGVETHLPAAADVALAQIAAQGRGATLQDRIDRRKLLGRAMRHLKIIGEVGGEDIRQLQGRFDRRDVEQRT